MLKKCWYNVLVTSEHMWIRTRILYEPSPLMAITQYLPKVIQKYSINNPPTNVPHILSAVSIKNESFNKN